MSILSRVLCIAAGILLIIGGFFCLTHEAAAILTLAVLLGVMMLFSGILELLLFAKEHNAMYGSGWILLDGIVTTVLGVLLLGNQAFSVISLPFLFSMWLLFTGIARIVSAFDLKKVGVRSWGWVLAMGIILVLGGMMTIFDPVAGLFAITFLVGFSFILEGIDTIVAGFASAGKQL